MTEQDRCVCFGEYTARAGFGYSEMNQLIANLKKPADRRGRPEWRYKEEAIQAVVTMLSRQIKLDALVANGATLVPVPPSAHKDDAAYDDRLLQIVEGLREYNPRLDVRELLLNRASRQASHTLPDGQRPTPQQQADNLMVNEDCVDPPPRVVLLIDDVLTTGATYKGSEMVLKQRFPELQMGGFFIARRVPTPEI